MTRPKADSDPWLTDMVTRDREVAKSVVYGLRTIISLLRGIRDEMAEEGRQHRIELRETRQEMRDLWEYVMNKDRIPEADSWELPYEHCDTPGCSLPPGHDEPHRGTLSARR